MFFLCLSRIAVFQTYKQANKYQMAFYDSDDISWSGGGYDSDDYYDDDDYSQRGKV